jgi:hypothetical protein
LNLPILIEKFINVSSFKEVGCKMTENTFFKNLKKAIESLDIESWKKLNTIVTILMCPINKKHF